MDLQCMSIVFFAIISISFCLPDQGKWDSTVTSVSINKKKFCLINNILFDLQDTRPIILSKNVYKGAKLYIKSKYKYCLFNF